MLIEQRNPADDKHGADAQHDALGPGKKDLVGQPVQHALAERGADHRDRKGTQQQGRGWPVLSAAYQHTEINDFGCMRQRLYHCLGRHDLMARQRNALEKNIQDRTADKFQPASTLTGTMTSPANIGM